MILGDLGQILTRLFGVAEVEQARDDVQPVGELMLLGAQGVGQSGDRIHPADQGFELGTIAQRHDAANRTSADIHGAPVDHQQSVFGKDRLIRS